MVAQKCHRLNYSRILSFPLFVYFFISTAYGHESYSCPKVVEIKKVEKETRKRENARKLSW